MCVINDIVLGDIEEMMGIEEVEDTSRTLLQDRCNDADKEQQRIMDVLELVVNETQNIICDSGLISLSAGSGEEQNGSNAGEMQVQGSTDSLPNSKEAEVEKIHLFLKRKLMRFRAPKVLIWGIQKKKV